jgi:hypothetical protein
MCPVVKFEFTILQSLWLVASLTDYGITVSIRLQKKLLSFVLRLDLLTFILRKITCQWIVKRHMNQSSGRPLRSIRYTGILVQTRDISTTADIHGISVVDPGVGAFLPPGSRGYVFWWDCSFIFLLIKSKYSVPVQYLPPKHSLRICYLKERSVKVWWQHQQSKMSIAAPFATIGYIVYYTIQLHSV